MFRRLSSGHLLFAVAAVTGIVAACGSSDDSKFGDGTNAGEDGGGTGTGVFGNQDDGGEGSGDGATGQTLRIDPPTLTVTVGGTLKAPMGSGTFTAYLGTNPTPVTARWSADDIRYGTIDATGKFTGKAVGGKTKIRARVGSQEALADVEVKVVLSENFANASEDVKTKLRAGGNADGAFKWLYPYDRTVFPRGLPAPTLQFEGAKPTTYRVRLKNSRMDVEGFYSNVNGTNAARVAVATEWWNAVTFGTDSSESVEIEVTKIVGNSVTGPKKVTWHVAPGSLRGAIYYNSYNSSKAYPDPEWPSGAVLAIKPGKSLDVLLKSVQVPGASSATQCIVCHSVSASGNRLVTGIGWSDQAPDNSNPIYSGSFNLGPSGATLNKSSDDGRVYPFGGLSPDGKYLLTNSASNDWPIRGLSAYTPSKLIDVASGNVLKDKFFPDKELVAISPTFSPDGKRVAFSDGKKTISVAKFDASTNPPTLSELNPVYTTTKEKLGWPTFTPDGNAILAHEGTAFDTEKNNTADLVWIDVATEKATLLDALNGKSGGSYYLPYGEPEDGHKNYEPTLLPVAVGGYYWVVFTSRRSLGNTVYNGPNSVNAAGDTAYDPGENRKRGVRKKLWVAAIDINRPASKDISYPAFYLEGQELEAGNMRGFWALEQCKADGSTCEGGDECCNGFCRNVEQPNGSTVAQCVPPPASCANESERCTVDADCCNAPAGTKCLNKSCTTPGPSTPK